MGCHFLLQGIFLTQGSNLRLLHWQAGSLPLSHLFRLHVSDIIAISLSDLLHLVWQSLGSVMLLKTALFHSFFLYGWVIRCMYTSRLLYPFIFGWTLRLLPYIHYCEQCCYEHWSVRIYIFFGFPSGSAGKESTSNAGDLGSIPGYFLLFKLWKWNKFTGDLENREQLHIVPLYITIIFSIDKLRCSVGVSISNSQKLIERIDRKVEGCSRLEKHYEPTQHN